MAFHKFRVGQKVNFLPNPKDPHGLRGSYAVVRLLPSETRDLQYRVKGDHEGHERVAHESQLVAASPAFSPFESWTQRIQAR